MSGSVHSLALQALELDPGERLELAAELIDSVEGPEDPERAAAADQREAGGEPRGAPWSEVRARLVSELAKG